MLPKGCIKCIEAQCSRFLWSINIEKKNIAKIAWTTVCLPKEEGGLGMRNLSIWNQVLCLKFIWTLLSKTVSLWAEWHWSTHLQNKSFWTVEVNVNDFSVWRKLLELRTLAIQFCNTKLGSGKTASFWFDASTPFGQLINFIGPNGPRALRIMKNAMVADAIRGVS